MKHLKSIKVFENSDRKIDLNYIYDTYIDCFSDLLDQDGVVLLSDKGRTFHQTLNRTVEIDAPILAQNSKKEEIIRTSKGIYNGEVNESLCLASNIIINKRPLSHTVISKENNDIYKFVCSNLIDMENKFYKYTGHKLKSEIIISLNLPSDRFKYISDSHNGYLVDTDQEKKFKIKSASLDSNNRRFFRVFVCSSMWDGNKIDFNGFPELGDDGSVLEIYIKHVLYISNISK